jgi:homoserine O-acetyltransferase
MDLHDVAYERGALEEVLAGIKTPTLCVGINTDVLYPVQEQKRLASQLVRSAYREIDSPFGHDAFLIEHEQLGKFVKEFLRD